MTIYKDYTAEIIKIYRPPFRIIIKQIINIYYFTLKGGSMNLKKKKK